MNDSVPRRWISGLQGIAIIAGVLVFLAVLGAILGWWTLWIDFG